nr:ATP-binding cassette domain-containing protein [Xylanimonas allomyrinae]
MHAHEVVALVGDNAAGKSTLAKIISGVLQPDAGFIELDGEPVTVPSPAAAHALGIATVFQDLALCENLDVVENLYLGRELRQTRRGLARTAKGRRGLGRRVLGRRAPGRPDPDGGDPRLPGLGWRSADGPDSGGPDSGGPSLDGSRLDGPSLDGPGLERPGGPGLGRAGMSRLENLEPHRRGGLGTPLDDAEMEEEARRILTSLTANIPSVRTPLSVLSAGQRQTVAIARTLLGHPRVVVLDEPTASLSVAHTAEVLTHIESLRDLGHAVVLISHNMSDVRAVADRIEVLRHGRNNGSFEARSATYEKVVAAITGATALGRG